MPSGGGLMKSVSQKRVQRGAVRGPLHKGQGRQDSRVQTNTAEGLSVSKKRSEMKFRVGLRKRRGRFYEESLLGDIFCKISVGTKRGGKEDQLSDVILFQIIEISTKNHTQKSPWVSNVLFYSKVSRKGVGKKFNKKGEEDGEKSTWNTSNKKIKPKLQVPAVNWQEERKRKRLYGKKGLNGGCNTKQSRGRKRFMKQINLNRGRER